MRERLILGMLIVLLPRLGAGQAVPARVSLAQFTSLRWLEGSWHGSGGNFPSFFERYRFVDDSTIAMEASMDSTFATISERKRLELRDGAVRQAREGTPGSFIVALHADSVRWGYATGGNGTLFIRRGPGHWSAVLERDGRVVVTYEMRRLPK